MMIWSIFQVFEGGRRFSSILSFFSKPVVPFTTHLLAFVALAFTGEAIPFFWFCDYYDDLERKGDTRVHYIHELMHSSEHFIIGGFLFSWE